MTKSLLFRVPVISWVPVISFVIGCSTSTSTVSAADASTSTAESGTGAGDCLFPSFEADAGVGRCPSGCLPVSGSRVDSARQCVLSPTFFGCVGCRSPEGCGGAPEGPCYRYVPGGQIVRIPVYAAENDPGGSNHWVRCTDEEDRLFTLPSCN